MGAELTFIILAAVTLIPAVMVVTTRNVMHAGLWLMPTLVGVAGFFLTLGAEFVAAVQVLIYIGGIMVLLLFAVLLTRGIANPDIRSHTRLEALGGLAAVAVTVILIASVYKEFARTVTPIQQQTGTTENIGQALLTTYLLPFEIASIVLLAAIIGAIVVARGEQQ